MVFCKSFAAEHRTSTTVAPENNLESTHNHHQLYLSWLLHSVCYSCCYFISIPMRIAAVGQHKAIKSPKPNTCRWEMMIRSLPPWPQHRSMPIKRSYSNLPMDLRRTVECLFARRKAEGNSLLFYFCGGVIIIIFQHKERVNFWCLKGKNSYPPAFLPLKGKKG